MALSGRTEVLSNGTETRHYRIGYEPEVWRRGRFLGLGGFGQVWEENLVSGYSQIKVRAVKTVSKSTSSEQHLRQELEIILTFSDMNDDKYRDYFVGCYCWFQDAMNIYIAMECFPLGDLQKFIDGAEGRKKPVAEAEAVTIVAQVARALQHMHDKGVVHRDLKPQNILVDTPGPNWRVKLTDFGVSKSMQSTILDTAVGTSVYKAPELYDIPESGPYDGYTAAVDVWSLGAVAFCVRTGRPPFRSAGDIFKFKYNQMEFPTNPLRASTIRCMEFVLHTMEKIPEKRPLITQVLELEWIRSATENVTTNLSSSRVETFENEASASWGSLANSSDRGANDSTFTVRPFMGKEPSSMSNHMSSRATAVQQIDPDTIKPLSNPSPNSNLIAIPATVFDHEVAALPFRPIEPHRPSPVLMIGTESHASAQMTTEDVDKPSSLPVNPNATKELPIYSNSKIDTVLPSAILNSAHSNTESKDKDSHHFQRAPTPPNPQPQAFIDSRSNDISPVSNNHGTIQPRPESQLRSDSGYHTSSTSSVPQTKITASQDPKKPWSKYLDANSRTTCLTCGHHYGIRDDLYDHLEEEQHGVDLDTKVPESYVRPEHSRQRQRDQEWKHKQRTMAKVEYELSVETFPGNGSSANNQSSTRSASNSNRTNREDRRAVGTGGQGYIGGEGYLSGQGYGGGQRYGSGRDLIYTGGYANNGGGYYSSNGFPSGGRGYWSGGGRPGYSSRGYGTSAPLPKKKSKWYKRVLDKF